MIYNFSGCVQIEYQNIRIISFIKTHFERVIKLWVMDISAFVW